MAICAAVGAFVSAARGAPALEGVELPAGFRIEPYVADLPNARSMVLGAQGTLFVGTRSAGKVYAVRERGGKREVATLASGLNMPNGVAFRDGSLYVAEVHRILRFDDVEAQLAKGVRPEQIKRKEIAQLPRDRHHGWRYIAFGPEGKLYVPIGAPCNVCDRPGYAVITRMNADGSGREVVARGVRNTVGFTWHPRTGELWFTDNGRDFLGDDTPPCELNRLGSPGAHFGYPFCHGRDVVDPELGKLGRCADIVAPVQELPAHSAPLGVKFYTGSMFPADYQGRAFVAEHGSWNRSEPTGYRVSTVRLEGDRAADYEVFAAGWLVPDGKVKGRPVDLLVLADGSMLVSDDHAGAIYRISYRSGG
jgi:glucose/arabinose dehydrogenase